MSSISRLFCLIFALLQTHYGHSMPSHSFSAQTAHKRSPAFETGPIDPARFPSRDGQSSGNIQEPKEMENLDLKILGNAIGEGIVKAQQNQKLQPSIYEESPRSYQKKDSESSVFQQPQRRRKQKGHHHAASQTKTFQIPVDEQPEMLQAPSMGRSRAFQEPAAERSQLFQDPIAGQYQAFQEPMAKRSQVIQEPILMAGQAQMNVQPSFEWPRQFRQPFSMLAPPRRSRKMMGSMPFGQEESDAMRSSMKAARGYRPPQAGAMPMQWRPDVMGRN